MGPHFDTDSSSVLGSDVSTNRGTNEFAYLSSVVGTDKFSYYSSVKCSIDVTINISYRTTNISTVFHAVLYPISGTIVSTNPIAFHNSNQSAHYSSI